MLDINIRKSQRRKIFFDLKEKIETGENYFPHCKDEKEEKKNSTSDIQFQIKKTGMSGSSR